MIKKLLIVLLIFLTQYSYAQYAYFVFTNCKFEDRGWIKSYNESEITVNNFLISRQDHKFKVKINLNQLDTIKIKSSDSILCRTIYTKLRPKETYKITYSDCSFIEITPISKHEGPKLVRLVSLNRGNAKLFFNSAFCFIDTTQIWHNDTTDYYNNVSSGYCPFAISVFNICYKENIINITEYEKNCFGISMLFTGLEMYTLYYDYKTNKMTAKFDGYYNKKRNIKIGEFWR